MKALSLHQPWASCIALGLKRIETRGWKTAHRGPLAIHASKSVRSIPEEGLRLGDVEVWRTPGRGHDLALWRPGDRFAATIPTGAVVATCELAGCVRVATLQEHVVFTEKRIAGQWIYRTLRGGLRLVTAVAPEHRGGRPVVNEYSIDDEDPLGDFAPGRYGWLLKDITPLEDPVVIAGAQGLWELDDRLVA